MAVFESLVITFLSAINFVHFVGNWLTVHVLKNYNREYFCFFPPKIQMAKPATRKTNSVSVRN